MYEIGRFVRSQGERFSFSLASPERSTIYPLVADRLRERFDKFPTATQHSAGSARERE